MGHQMGLSGHSRALRAIALAWGIAWLGPGYAAGTPETSGASNPVESAEPFALFAAPLSGGALPEKWLGVQRRLDDEMVQLALCEGDRDGCTSPAALRL